MSGWFTRMFKRGQTGKDVVETTVEVQPLEEQSLPTTATALNQILLDLTHEQQGEYSILDIQKFEQFLAACPPLAIGQFDFQAFEAGPFQGGWFARVFLRNAVSVGDLLNLQVVPLSLYDANNEKLASHVFELSHEPVRFGEARLHTFYWPGETSLKPLALADLSKFRVDMV